MTNILVTGSAGYIGSIVTEFLVEKGYSVIGIDNFQEGNRGAVNKNIVFCEGDFGNSEFLSRIFKNHKIEYVFHLAAETTIEFSMTEPAKYFHNNVVNGITLLDTMLKFNCYQIIFSSTAATFGEPQYTPIDEKHPQIPINSYGESKLIYERILDWYNYAYEIEFNLFRYFNAAGATKTNGEDREHESHLLPLIFETINGKRDTLYVFGNDYNTKDGTCIRDYIHVKDVADAHLLAMDNLKVHSRGKYNLGSGIGFSNLEVINAVEKVTNKKVNWEFSGRRVGDPAVLIASSNLAKSELGWNPVNSSIEQIVRDAYNWAIEHLNGYSK